MFAARQQKEVVVEVLNETGVLHDLARIVAEKGINILAVCGERHGKNAVIRMITDDNLRASDALKAHDYAPMEADVVTAELDHRPGMLMKLADRLGREGIDIGHIAVTGLIGQDKCLAVLSCSDNARAAVVLNK